MKIKVSIVRTDPFRADRLTKVSSNSIVVLQNWYDVFGRRVAKQEVVNGQMQKRLYLYAGWTILGVMNENGQILETFTRGVGLAGDIGTLVAVTHHNGSAVTPGTYYTHHNHRGDVIVTRNGTTTTGTYDYSAFGSLKTQTGTDVCRFKFSSKEREASCGFSYYGVRFYAPQWQRWPNHDPIGELGFEVLRYHSSKPLRFFEMLRRIGGNNLYEFVRNQPTDYLDYLGLGAGPFSIACMQANSQADAAWQMYLSEPSTYNFALAEAAAAYAEEVCSPPPSPPPLVPPMCPNNPPQPFPWSPPPPTPRQFGTALFGGGFLIWLIIIAGSPVGV